MLQRLALKDLSVETMLQSIVLMLQPLIPANFERFSNYFLRITRMVFEMKIDGFNSISRLENIRILL